MRHAILVMLVMLVALAACSDDSIVLAKLAATDAQVAPIRCAVPGDCPSGTFCLKTTCGDPAGTCELFPAQCDDVDKPVCGCDGITYLDDCLRKAAGVSASTPGPCRLDHAVSCGGFGNVQCPTDTFCARIAGKNGPCGTDILGSCWVLPAVCPTSASSTSRARRGRPRPLPSRRVPHPRAR